MESYYDILQVHPKADPEVIEAAYKKLAMKYHPDKLGNEDKMKAINQAYDVLKKQETREAYDQSLKKIKKHSEPNPRRNYTYQSKSTNKAEAEKVLFEYFRMLQQRHFKAAYDMIALADQKKITLSDFTKWQGAVSKVYAIRAQDIRLSNTLKNVYLNGEKYKEIVIFDVIVEEWNSIMETLERDYLKKQVVFESGCYKIYMGIEAIQGLIEKFEVLSQLLEFKNDWHFLPQKTRPLMTERAFFYTVYQEQLRSERYGREFSLMLISCSDFDFKKCDMIGRWIKRSIRQVDTIGYDRHGNFIVLMPETTLSGAIKAGEKVKKGLERMFVNSKGVICIGPFQQSVEKTMSALYKIKSTQKVKKGFLLAYHRILG